MTSHKVRGFGSSIPIRDATGSDLSIFCLMCSAYVDLTRWDPYTYWLLQMQADICSLGCSSHTLRVFPLCTSWHYCHGSHLIQFVKSKSPQFFMLYTVCPSLSLMKWMLPPAGRFPSYWLPVNLYHLWMLQFFIRHQETVSLGLPAAFQDFHQFFLAYTWVTESCPSDTSSASAAEWKQPCWGLLALGLSSFLFRPILLLFREPHWSSLCISCAQALFWALEIQPWTKQTQTPALMELTFPWERQTTNKINK